MRRGGWPIRAVLWLEWGISTVGQNLPCRSFVFRVVFPTQSPSCLTARCIVCGLQIPHSKFRKEREI
jgi:hypothetical protein